MVRRSVFVGVLGVVAVLAGCSSGPDRGDVLRATAAEIVVPAFDAFEADVRALSDAAAAFCAGPSETGAAEVRTATVDARAAWAYTEVMWVGPVMERRSWARVDWPIVAEEIEELLADESIELDLDRIGSRIGADQRGLGAVEYLIDTEVASFDDPRRCDYLVSVLEIVRIEAEAIVSDWTGSFDGGPPYLELIGADDAAVDGYVNESVFLLEATTDLELGVALGVTGADRDIDAVMEGPLDTGVADLDQRLAGLNAVLVGNGEAPGLRELLSDDLAERLELQIAEARDSVMAIDGSLRSAIEADSSLVAAARDAIKVVQVTVSTEVVSELGVTIGFSDADGDTGG